MLYHLFNFWIEIQNNLIGMGFAEVAMECLLQIPIDIPEPILDARTTMREEIGEPIALKQKFPHTLFFYLLLFSVFVVLFIKLRFRLFFENLFDAFQHLNLAKQFFQDQQYSFSQASLLMNLNIALVLGLLLSAVLLYFDKLSFLSEGALVGLGSFLVAGLLLLRYVLYKSIALVLPIKQTLNFYLFNLFIMNAVLSIVLLPFIALMIFAQANIAKVALGLTTILLCFFLFYRVYRGLKLGKEQIAFHKYHFFIYLCALEIAPILILAKLAVNYIA